MYISIIIVAISLEKEFGMPKIIEIIIIKWITPSPADVANTSSFNIPS